MRKFLLLVLVVQFLLGFMALTPWGRQLPDVDVGAAGLIDAAGAVQGPPPKDPRFIIPVGFRFGSSSKSDNSNDNNCNDSDGNDSDENNSDNKDNLRRGPPGRGPPGRRGRRQNNNNSNNDSKTSSSNSSSKLV